MKAVTMATGLFMITAGVTMVIGLEEVSGDYNMTNVLGMWKLDDEAGTEVNYSSFNELHGTLYKERWSA